MAARRDEVVFDDPLPSARVGTTGYELHVPIALRDGTAYLCQLRVWNGEAKFTQDNVRITDPVAVEVFLGVVHERLPSVTQSATQHAAWRQACVDISNYIPNAMRAQLVKQQAEQQSASQSQATRLVAIAQATELFHTPSGEPYATFRVGSHYETWPLSSTGFRTFLARQYYIATRATPGSQALQDAINALSGQAAFDGNEQEVHVRIASDAIGALYLDLADPEWRVVQIDPSGWRVLTEVPVRFRRPRGMQALPAPVAGGTLDALRRFIKPASEEDWKLRLGWLIGACNPNGPYAVLYVLGEQGSAKSVQQKALRRMIDPNVADLRRPPREEIDLLIAARNGWVVGFDNLSHLSDWLSDALCRVASGAGLGTRQLYTNLDEALIAAARPIIFNGIGDLTLRGDLVDRSIIQTQPRLRKKDRRAEKRLWADFAAAQPQLLGALCDVLVQVLKNLPRVQLDHLPRMGDFATWVTAAEPALGWQPGELLELFEANQARAHHVVVEASVLSTHLLAFIRAQPGKHWTGTASQLLVALELRCGEEELRALHRPRSGWPSSSTWLSNALRRLAPTLAVTDQLTVTFDEKARPRQITLTTNSPSSESTGKIASEASEGLSPVKCVNRVIL
jgi:hypothetical protein